MFKILLIIILIIQFFNIAFAEVISVKLSMPQGSSSGGSTLNWSNLQEPEPKVTSEVTNDKSSRVDVEVNIDTELHLLGNLYIEAYYNEEAEEVLLSRRLKF